KIICNLNNAPDSPHLHTFSSNQRHCFQCEDVLGDGELYQRCTCMSISENSSQTPPHINHHCCYECGDPLDGIFFHQCTYESCWKDESPFTCDSTPNIVDDSPNVSTHLRNPQSTRMSFVGTMLIMLTIVNLKFRLPRTRNRQLPVIDHTPLEESMKNLRIAFQAWSENIQQKKEEEEKQITEEQEPDNSLSMRDEHLDTISTTESYKFIKSSVENLVPNLKSLLNHDSLIISSSSNIDSLLDEFIGKLTLLKSIPPGINETDCDPQEEIHLIKKLLYDNSSPRPLEEFISKNSDVAIKSFSPSPIPVEDSDSFMEEIDLSFTLDDPMPPGIKEDDYDSERDILILEELLSNDSLSL
nr:hypothetical protein [Tanacetum cinerariifolium]